MNKLFHSGLKILKNFKPTKSFEILKQYDDKYKMSAYPHIPIASVALAIFGVGSAGVAGYFLFKKPIDNMVAKKGSDITGQIVVSDQVKKGVNKLIADEEIVNQVTELLKDAVLRLCDDADINNKLVILLASSIDKLSKDENVKNNLTDLFVEIFKSTEIKTQLNVLINDACNEKSNRDAISKMIDEILQNNVFIDELKKHLRKIILGSIFG